MQLIDVPTFVDRNSRRAGACRLGFAFAPMWEAQDNPVEPPNRELESSHDGELVIFDEYSRIRAGS